MSKEFNEGLFREAIARIQDGKGMGDAPAKPLFDPQVHRDVVDSYVGGRKIESYRQVLEHHGFRFYPANRCPPYPDGSRPKEGQWRCNRHELAFTSDEVCAHFPKGPQEFDEWMQAQIMQTRARAAGLVLPG